MTPWSLSFATIILLQLSHIITRTKMWKKKISIVVEAIRARELKITRDPSRTNQRDCPIAHILPQQSCKIGCSKKKQRRTLDATDFLLLV